MEYHNEYTINEVIEQVLDRLNARDLYVQLNIEKLWREAMGVSMTKFTTKLSYKNHVLTVFVSNPLMKKELMISKTAIKNLMNEKIGRNIIYKIEIE